MMRWISVTALIVLLCSTMLRAQPDSDLRDKLVRGGPVMRDRVRHLIVTEHPEFPSRVLAFVAERWPTLPTQVALARLQVVREHLPPEAVPLIMADINARHPHLVTKTALAFWTLAAEDNTVPLLIDAQRREVRAEMATLVADRYPHLLEDIAEVVRTHDPTLPSAIRKEVADAVHATDPRLRADLGHDVAALLARHPAVLLTVLGRDGGGRLDALHHAMCANPRFAVALWTMLDEKYADRLFAVSLAVVKTLSARHDTGDVVEKVLRMVESRYPRLAFDVATVVVGTRLRTPDAFLSTLAQRLQTLHGSLASDFQSSVDRHAPGLRAACRAAMQAKFEGVADEVRAYVDKTWPDLRPRLERL